MPRSVQMRLDHRWILRQWAAGPSHIEGPAPLLRKSKTSRLEDKQKDRSVVVVLHLYVADLFQLKSFNVTIFVVILHL